MGVDAPEYAAPACPMLTDYIDTKLNGAKADRVFMYNPDAIAQWLEEKYPQLLKEVNRWSELEIPYCSVMPSVTPVCFGTMYTGAQPEVHGIRRYEKPVITIDSIFDAMIVIPWIPYVLPYAMPWVWTHRNTQHRPAQC